MTKGKIMTTLVICDDEITIRAGLKNMIEKNSDNIEIVGLAANGAEAYKIISETRPNVVLLDITMPAMTGFEVIQKVSAQSPSTQFIIVTGHDEFKYAQQALKLHVFDYLLKPIKKDALFSVISRASIKSKEILDDETENKDDDKENKNVAQTAVDYILKNYTDPEISLAKLASSLFVSESYLTRIIKNSVGKSYSEYVTELRMIKAKHLLVDSPNLLIKEVAEQSGYLNRHYFCNLFKNSTGLTPTQYRDKHTLDNI